jgi:hypothetical protein
MGTFNPPAPSPPPRSLVYNVTEVDAAALVVDAAVRVDVYGAQGGKVVVRSAPSVDGGKAWKTVLAGNTLSFEGVYEMNAAVDIAAAVKILKDEQAKAWAKIRG